MSTYRVSALAAALLRMWRGWRVVLPVVLANALLQAGLIEGQTLWGGEGVALAAVVLSAAAFSLAYGLLSATALEVADGRVSWSQAWRRLRTHALRYFVSVLMVLALVLVGMLANAAVALAVVSVTVFVPLAALDDQGAVVRVAIVTIRRRFWRWLVTATLMSLAVAAGSVLIGFTSFFLRGALAAGTVWVVAGLVVSWLVTAWALIFRSAWQAGPQAPHPEPAPNDHPGMPVA